MADLEKQIQNILNEEASRTGMKVKTDVISKSPAAVIPGHRESYLVRMAEAVHRAAGFNPPNQQHRIKQLERGTTGRHFFNFHRFRSLRRLAQPG
jgi:hypothetical protein